MSKFTIKNKKIFSTSFLVVYLLFLGISIFHTHNIDLKSSHKVNYTEESSTSSSFDPYLNDNGRCLIHQFNSTVSIRYTSASEVFNFENTIKLNLTETQRFLPQDHQINFYLRGPPKV